MSSDAGPLRPPPHAIVFGPHANCTLAICPVESTVYGYRPSLAANITLIVLFALAAAIHTYLGIRWRQWWFTGCVLVGTASAIIGYIGRVLMYNNPFSFNAFMLQIICITTVPVYYCAAIYVTLAMAINALPPSLSRFRPALFYYVFIPCDIFSLAFQAAGGALSTSSSGTNQTGVDLSLLGLSLQVFTIVIFCGFFADYLVRYFRSEVWRRRKEGGVAAAAAPDGGAVDGQPVGVSVTRLKLFFGFLVLAILLTLMRCAYRLAELHAGYSGNLVRDEGLFIGFEGVLVIVAFYCLMIGHPGLVFKPAQKELDSGGSRQELQELIVSTK